MCWVLFRVRDQSRFDGVFLLWFVTGPAPDLLDGGAFLSSFQDFFSTAYFLKESHRTVHFPLGIH